jgi:hypothetical protein
MELIIKTGLLPYLSESLPRIGEKINWKKEKRAITTPTKKGFPPTSLIRRGKIGIAIPKPSKSINTTRRRISSLLFGIG